MAARLVAGVDCSTQGTKVLVVDPDDGRVVALGRASHDVTGRDGARETDPEQWWSALQQALATTGRAADVAAISIAGQQHGLVCLDAAGRPLRPAMLWNDTRAAPDAAELVAKRGAEWWADEVGVVPVASFTAAKWAWLRRVEPETAAATRAVRLPHDYLTERLTGRGVTDRGDASGTAWWSTATEAYVPEVLETIALDTALLPEVLRPDEAAGTVTSAAAEALGLPTDAVVGPGTGDNMGAALGLGLPAGVPVLSLGTSGTAYTVSETRAVDPSGVVAGFADASGRFLPLAATLNCTLAVDRVAAWLGLERDAAEPGDGVVVMPYFDGERTPNLPMAAGTIAGLRHHTTPAQVLGATYEGAVVSLLEALDALDEASSGIVDDAPIVLIGGGARGRVWREVVARLSGRALEIPAAEELVALGAAVQATSVLTGEDPASVAARWDTRAGDRVDPQPRDDATLARIRTVREAAHALHTTTW